MIARCGGTSETKPATEETQNMIDELKGEIYEKAGREYPQLKAVNLRNTYGIIGTNYFVKVDCGENNYIHVRITIDREKERLTVHSVALDKTLDEEPEPFNI